MQLAELDHYFQCSKHFVTLGRPSTTDVQKEEEEEDLYAPLGVNDEYDTIMKTAKAVAIANRPPAPTPRPESTGVEDYTPYIAQGNYTS